MFPQDTYLIAIGVWVICGIGSYMIAQGKGLNPTSWFVVGVLLGPLGILLALVAKPTVPADPVAPVASAEPAPSSGIPTIVWVFGAMAVGLVLASIIISAT